MSKLKSSFRDPDGFLYKEDGTLYRQINPTAFEDYQMLMESGLYEELTKRNFLVSHQEIAEKSDEQKKVIQPELVPFISYPYEWSFSQLKDAARLTLRIQKIALKFGMSLKDATAYNVQFVNGRPVMIDTLSFEKYVEGKPWVAYKQFCQHFLAPLALASYRDIRAFHLLRVNIDGIPLDLASSLLPFKSKLNFGLATHIHLHAKTQSKYADKQENAKEQRKVKKIGLLGLVDNLFNTVKKLKWNPKGTEWGDYYTFTNYTDSSFDEKKKLVSSFIAKSGSKDLWDLGANDGTFSSLGAEAGLNTVAFDIDPIAVEKNYLRVKQAKSERMLPLVMDLTNPSTGLGWAHSERDSLEGRGKVGCAMALALIHHISISNNVPLEMVAEYLSKLADHVIIEFVPKEDSQVKILLATREDVFPTYHLEGFEAAFSNYFDTVEKQQIEGTERTLFLYKTK